AQSPTRRHASLVWGCLVAALLAMTPGACSTVAGSRFGPGCRPSASPSASVAPLAPQRATTGQGVGPLALAAPHCAASADRDRPLAAAGRGRAATPVHRVDGVRGRHAGGPGAAESAAERRADRTSVTTARAQPRASPDPAGGAGAGTATRPTAGCGRATG